jgi:homeobox protein cut-like
MTRDDDEAPIESSAANASAYVPSFDDFDHAVTSALDALDSLSVFGGASDDRSGDDECARAARAWREARWMEARDAIARAKERRAEARESEHEAKRRLKERLVAEANDAKAVTRALTEEVKRLSAAREADFEAMDVVFNNESLFSAPAPDDMLERVAAYRRELDAARVERDAAKEASTQMAASGADAERARATMEERMREKIDQALRVMEAKKKAAEKSADSARQGKAQAEQKLSELQKRYDAAQNKLFDLEGAAELGAAQMKAERDELYALSEELRQREEALETAENRRREERAAAMDGPKDDIDVRERLAVKERMVAQLAASVETAEAAAKSAVEARDASAASLGAQIAQLRDELVKARSETSKESTSKDEEISQLKSRVKLLQEMSGVNDEDDENLSTDAASTDVASAAAIQSLRDRNKKLSAEITVARREKDEATTDADVARGAQQAAERKYIETAEMVTTLETDLSTRLTKIIEDVTPAAGGDSDLLAILTAQRDRFKRRVSELDERTARLEREKVDAEDARKKLEADSVKLYEKLQYVQNYYSKQAHGGKTTVLRVDAEGIPVTDGTAPIPAQSQHAKNARYSCGAVTLNIEGERTAAAVDGMRRRAARYGCFGGAGAGDDIPGGDEGGIVSRYRRKYLARLNPFARFRQNENDESAASLPIHDRIGLTGGKMLMTSRSTRTLFSVYIILLHVFMFSHAFGGASSKSSAVS